LGSKPKILVIDDDPTIRNTVEAALKLEGFIIDTAETGKEAIAKSKENFYNLALIDIRLPDLDGTKLLKKLKDWTPKTRKIIITGYPTMPNAVEAVNKNADAYLIKPVEMDKIVETVKDQLKKQEERKRYDEEKVAEFIETRLGDVDKTAPNKGKSKAAAETRGHTYI
jgi:DNA-binding NtrC family response regulator